MKNYGNMAKKNWNSTVDFFVNLPEGARYCQNSIEIKIRHYFYFKKFKKLTIFIIGRKKIQVKIDSFIDFLKVLDLHKW